MFRTLVFATFFFFILICQSMAQVGSVFPVITTRGLNGKQLILPEDLDHQKYTLLAVAAAAESQRKLESWFYPLYTTFVEPPKVNYLPEDPYNVDLYFVPMINLIGLTIPEAKERYFSKIDLRYQERIYVYDGPVRRYFDKLKIGLEDEPYFYLLDETGKVIYSTYGSYTAEKMEAIRAFLDAAEK